MKRILISALLIFLVTYVNFNRDEIINTFKMYRFRSENHALINNTYTHHYNFNYVKYENNTELNDENDIVNSVFSFLNSGTSKMGRHCSNEYVNCIDDVKKIANDNDLLSHINDFVHPFNSFKNITFSVDGSIIYVTSEKVYSESKISLINEKVDKILNQEITSNLSDYDKIKKIHDYIINNTKYDTLKSSNINDKTYESNTAYGVLFEGFGTCSGYADLMAIFLTKMNIKNYKISNETHIWNLVYIDGRWLHLDLTWDDPVTMNNKDLLKYDYFLIDSAALKALNDDEHSFSPLIYQEAK